MPAAGHPATLAPLPHPGAGRCHVAPWAARRLLSGVGLLAPAMILGSVAYADDGPQHQEYCLAAWDEGGSTAPEAPASETGPSSMEDTSLATLVEMTLDIPAPQPFSVVREQEERAPAVPVGRWCRDADGDNCEAHPLPPVPSSVSLSLDSEGAAFFTPAVGKLDRRGFEASVAFGRRDGLAPQDGLVRGLERPPRS